MKSLVCRLYGQQDLRLETDTVLDPRPDEILVKIGRGGICGSDLHYFQHGGFGTIHIAEPIIMGHEIAGTIEKMGTEVKNFQVGDTVGINPSQPCNLCPYCDKNLPQHCINMRFIGSAMRLPHEQGGFREFLTIKASQCEKSSKKTSIGELACAEPLAVCLHAVKTVTELNNKKILINGAGPIGSLCIAAVKYHNPQEIIVTDLFQKPLDVAQEMGADRVINLNSKGGNSLSEFSTGKGYFDAIFECSAAQTAINNIFNIIKPKGTIVQVGVTGNISYPMNLLVSKEIKWVGSHRFHYEYAEAINMISQKEINVLPIITDVFPAADIQKALQTAADRSRSVKVQIFFNE